MTYRQKKLSKSKIFIYKRNLKLVKIFYRHKSSFVMNVDIKHKNQIGNDVYNDPE